MKKKLLAVVLSVVMLAALFVPMMAISAEGAPTATLVLGKVELATKTYHDSGETVDVLRVPVYIEDNTGYANALNYKVFSNEGLECFYDSWMDGKREKEDTGFDEGTFEEEGLKFGNTIGRLSEGNKTYFQVLQTTVGIYGIGTEEGLLGYACFIAPTKIGTYTFSLEHISSVDDSNPPVQYVITIGEGTSYAVECKSHVAGEPEVTKEADCENAGEKVTKCTVCDAEMNKETIPALGHDWDNGVVAENVKCGETADTTFTCKREDCGKTKVEEGTVVPHDMVADAENSKPAKCEEAGVEATKCAREGCDHKETKTIAKLGHAMEADQGAGEAPTCTEDGKVVEKCTREGCDEVEETVIPALGHDFSGELKVVTAPTADAEGKYTIACVNGCGEVEEYAAKKLAAVVEHKDEDGKVIMGFKAENAILPEDILALPTGEPVEDKETGKISETIAFHSVLTPDLSGEVEFSIDSMGMFTNPVVTNAAGDVEFTFENGVLTFKADLADEYTITYEEVKTSPDTDDASSTVVFAVVALMAIAGLVVVGKKRFAL